MEEDLLNFKDGEERNSDMVMSSSSSSSSNDDDDVCHHYRVGGRRGFQSNIDDFLQVFRTSDR